jgi:DsbC/DsbD-like thiol-disulfide interchange protein
MIMRHTLAALAVLLPGAALAADPVPGAAASYLDGWREADGSRMTALAIRLDPGWRTYWRAPGETGIPPRFDWSGSENIAEVELLWPTPEVLSSAGFEYLGFTGALVLPIRVVPVDPGLPTHVEVTVDYGVCSNVCVPTTARLSAELVSAAPDGAGAGEIRAALARLPAGPEAAGLTAATCRLTPDGDALRLEAEFDFAGPAEEPRAVAIEAPVEDLWIAPATSARDGNRLTATARLEYFGTAPLILDRGDLRFTLIGQGGAIEITGCAAPG